MSNVETFARQMSAIAAITPYSMLDTDRDDEIAPEELVTPPEPPDDAARQPSDVPTVSSAETLTDPVAAALLDMHIVDDPTSTMQSAVAAYRGDDAAG
jgi:hypothetical protein